MFTYCKHVLSFIIILDAYTFHSKYFWRKVGRKILWTKPIPNSKPSSLFSPKVRINDNQAFKNTF